MPIVEPPRRPLRTTWGRRPAWRWLRRYFGFSRTENQGFIGLLLLALLAALGPLLIRPAAPVYLPSADQRQLNQWAAALTTRLDSNQAAQHQAYAARYPTHRPGGSSRYPTVAQVRLTAFDPNSLAASDWEARGVPHFVAGRLVNYGEKAGGFRAKSQIQRIYGLPDSVYQRLAPFMQLPAELPARSSAYANRPDFAKTTGAFPSRFLRKPAHLQPFDLNQADTTQLMQIKGIGRGRAKGLVKHRAELGGFVNENQLRDFFMLRDAPDLVDSLHKYTFVASGFAPRSVHINSATFDELWPHPYIGKPLARLIVAFRTQHGLYKTPEDLRQIKILKEEAFVRLQPYVRCD